MSSGSPKVITLCVDPPEKHLLRLVSSRSFASRPIDEPGEGPDIALFPASQNLDFIERALAAPPGLWRSAREGRGKVVFDASGEGKPHTADRTGRLHQLLHEVGVPLERAVYVTQDRGYARDYADHCAGIGLKRTIQVVVYDYWLRRLLGAFDLTGPEIFERRREAFTHRRRRRSRRFLSLNYTPRSPRLMFLLSLLHEDLWDLGHVSFGGFRRKSQGSRKSYKKIRKEFNSLPGFEDKAKILRPLLPELRERQSLLGEFPPTDPYSTALLPHALAEYDDSWFSVATETEMMDRPCRITEKPLKPLLNFHPLIVFGNPGALALIRELGFVTFPELFDESYDEECDPRRRFEMAFAQVRRLCLMDESGLARAVEALSEKVAFNAEWGLTRLPRIYRDELDEALMAALTA